MSSSKKKLVYSHIFETSDEVLRKIQKSIDAIGIKNKTQAKIMLVVKRNNFAWKRLCAELAKLSCEELRRKTHLHARTKRIKRFKESGIPQWKIDGWKTKQKFLKYHRERMRKIRAK